jgi:hypothetical protein
MIDKMLESLMDQANESINNIKMMQESMPMQLDEALKIIGEKDEKTKKYIEDLLLRSKKGEVKADEIIKHIQKISKNLCPQK